MSKTTEWAESWLNLRLPVCDTLPSSSPFLRVYIRLYSLPWRRWLYIRGGVLARFCFNLSELSFIIGITTGKISNATDNIYPQFLVGFPCKPDSPVRISTKALGAISGFSLLVIWGQLLSLAGVCGWVMRQNCGRHSFFVFGSYPKINFFGYCPW